MSNTIKIDLEEILDSHLIKSDIDLFGKDKEVLIACMKDVSDKTLDLAAYNAKAVQGHDALTWQPKIVVNKDSILNLKDCIK